ncbi:MAG: hypothetical protein HOC24_07700 [Deltaproteobacteria bacterium]|nr:hypothetical protein [Deltaproteobacteria bacterium]
MRHYKSILFLLFFTLTASISLADAIRRTHLFTRALAMGDAYTAVADSEETISHNPAGLLQEKVEWSLSFPILWLAYDELIRQAMVGEVEFDFEDEGFLEDVPGTRAYLEAQLGFPFWYHPDSGNFIGIGGNWWLELVFPRQTIIPVVHIENVQQLTFEYGTAWELWDWDLYFGTTIKAMKRQGYIVDVSILEVVDMDLDQLDKTYGSEPPIAYSADVGLLYRFEADWNPRIGLMIMDINGVKFDGVGKLRQFNAIGFAASHYYEDIHFTYSFDFHDFTYTYFSYKDTQRRLSCGVEAALGRHPDNTSIFSVQLGFKELRHLSYGISTRLGIVDTSLVVWKENYGTDDEEKIDKRYMFQIGFMF